MAEPIIKPIRFNVQGDNLIRLKRYLRDRVQSLREGLDQLHGINGVVKWRKCYEAAPAEESREFPFHGASNLIIPVVAIHTDTLLARVLSAVVKTKPYWAIRLLGDYADLNPPGVRDALEEFLQYVALEPEELDLYRVEREWFSEIIKLGTGVIKSPYVKKIEDNLAPAGDGSGKYEWVRKTIYEGPRPEKLRFEDFKYQVYKTRLEDMSFKYHIIRLQRDELEERAFRGIYDAGAVSVMLKTPDRTSPSFTQTQNEQSAKVATVPGYGFAEWDLCECHFLYRVDESHYARVMVWYHEKTDTIARSYYHYYPSDIFVAGRLFYRDDMFPGMGFAETLSTFQEELSSIHNNRRDNATVSTIKAWRVDPDSEANKGYRIYPSAMVPGKQGEIEALDVGTPVQGEIESERMTLDLADRRSGVSPPMQGAGTGTNTRRGIYTAMGTLSVMQEGNTRTDLNITDIRYAHTKLGRLQACLYAYFGIGDREAMFGRKIELIKDALAAMISGRAAIPIAATTSSVNREVEKQNDLMLMGIQERYSQMMLQLHQQINQPMVDDNTKKEIIKVMQSANTLYQSVLRHFGYDEVERLAPKPDVNPSPGPPQGQTPGSPPGMQPSGPGLPGGPSMPGGPAPPSGQGSLVSLLNNLAVGGMRQ